LGCIIIQTAHSEPHIIYASLINLTNFIALALESLLTEEILMDILRKQMIWDMELRGLAQGTQTVYLNAVRDLARYYGRSPGNLNELEVQSYQWHLREEQKLASTTCNVAASALRFFYYVTMKRSPVEIAIPRRHAQQRLPEIMSKAEIEQLITHCHNHRHRALLMAAYGSGLRVSELVKLKVSDIDSERKMIRVNQGKGAKDRYTLLPERLLTELRNWWRTHRHPVWIFPREDGMGPMSRDSAIKMFYREKARAGITKHCGIHGLRHAFATHLLEAGTDLLVIQRLLGHSNIRSTTRYFHLAQTKLAATASPLDQLALPLNLDV
jgi:site-specific recombinase XerD